MLDFKSRFGRHAQRRLREDKIVWLITADAQKTPQPRPVWFHWDGRNVLIFSERKKAKLRHIARNPRVALHFNTDEDGGDVVVFVGEAALNEAPPQDRVKAYLRKYRAGIQELGMTVEQFRDSYVVPILVTPESMRGFF
ncbi:MAG: TIGR03667 family PPOX class F420-dependent oxidoreductase [Candidatus Methylomirabilales bacterium]